MNELALPIRTTGLRELALFAGVGGGLLGTHLLGFAPVCAVEKEPYRREVLLRRQRDGVFPLFPIWDDARTFDGRQWRGKVDIVTAGFPCQPFSVAGKQLGEADERNMWPDTIRIIREIRPDYLFLENVPQLVRHDYFGVILGDLAEAGFDAEWDIVSAADVGAPHLRKRLWIVANAAGIRRAESQHESRHDGQHESTCEGGLLKSSRISWWDRDPAEGPVESRLGRVATGVANRVDRLSGIGDGQVPAVVQFAWLLLSGEIEDELENQT